MEPAPADFAKVARPYAIVIHIPFYVDRVGAVWLDRLWHHDLLQHLSYLPDLVLCAPSLPKDARPDLVRLEAPEGVRLRFVPLPGRKTRVQAIMGLPRTIAGVWSAAGVAQVVHTGIGGWPYPLGWIAVPAARLRRKKLVIGVESSWRHGLPGERRWSTRLYDLVSDAFARWACSRADLSFYTQEIYRNTLHRSGSPTFINPAVWVNDADIIDAARAESSWARKAQDPLRVLCAGRLIQEKGIDVLLSALSLLDRRRTNVSIDLIGSGERRAACARAAAELEHVRLSVLDPIPYGPAFFELLRRYHAVVVPSLTDEQPRIVFDANAQGVPVIASNTDGIRPHVVHEKTGWLVPPGDVAALADAIERASGGVHALRELGLSALASTRTRTHVRMHRARSHFLARHLS